jgi:glutamate synthase (NADPH/NADH) small chain
MDEKPKPKIDLNRIPMPHQKPEVRARNYEEVALGYTEEMALQEANRCIQCVKRPCVTGCPVDSSKPSGRKIFKMQPK